MLLEYYDADMQILTLDVRVCVVSELVITRKGAALPLRACIAVSPQIYCKPSSLVDTTNCCLTIAGRYHDFQLGPINSVSFAFVEVFNYG